MAEDVQVITGTPATIAARLCNFVTAQSFLLRSHENWLDSSVRPAVSRLDGPWIDLLGYASRLGSADFNRKLSFRRCEAAKAWISEYSDRSNFEIVWAKGEEESGPEEENNDGYWRAVEVYVYGTERPRPTPPDGGTPGTTDFKIRLNGGASAGIDVIGGDGYVFQIVDKPANLTSFFVYYGPAMGLSSPPGSMAFAGPFTSFRTTRPVLLGDFEGAARLFQDPGISLGPFGVGSLRLSLESEHLSRSGAAVFPSIIEIQTGGGLGAGLGAAGLMGELKRLTPALPFTEP